MGDTVPADNWGYYKVPRALVGELPDPLSASGLEGQEPERCRRGLVPAGNNDSGRLERTADRRFAEYLNSYAAVYLDGKKLGDMYFPSGEVDLTSASRPGKTQVLSLCVKAVPLAAVMQAFTDTSAPKTVKGSVERRGLCGDVFLLSTPQGARVDEVKVNTSVRKWTITLDVGLQGLAAGKSYRLKAEVDDKGRKIKDFTSDAFTAADVKDGRYALAAAWKPEKLWDTNTPQNMYGLAVSLVDGGGQALDVFRPLRFGFREFWIEGRDFYLNGTRFHSFIIPIDNAQMGAAWASYDACRETLLRDKSFGVNTVYTHNYGCPPGAHLSFSELLRAADDVGMLVALSQPHCQHYKWGSTGSGEEQRLRAARGVLRQAWPGTIPPSSCIP